MKQNKLLGLILAVGVGAGISSLGGCEDVGHCPPGRSIHRTGYGSNAAEAADHPLTWSDGGRTFVRADGKVTIEYDRDGHHFVETWAEGGPWRGQDE